MTRVRPRIALNFCFLPWQLKKIGGFLYFIYHVRQQSEAITFLKHNMKSWDEAAYGVRGEMAQREASACQRMT